MSDHSDLAAAYLTASRALLGIAVRSVQASPVDITVAQHRLLVGLAAHGPQNVSEIAAALGVNQSNASRHCDRLQRLGLIARHRSEEDGRVVLARLTPLGRQVVRAVTRRRTAEIARVLEHLPAQHRTGALRALQVFGAAADEMADRDWAW